MAAPLLEKYLQGKKGVTVENRRRILRLIENMTMGRNAVGYLSESLHGAGSPQAQRVLIQRLFDLETKKRCLEVHRFGSTSHLHKRSISSSLLHLTSAAL